MKSEEFSIIVAINCDGQPAEAEGLCIGMYGEDADFFALKGMIDQTMSLMGLGQPVYEAERNLPMYHPGRCANIIYEGELLGTIGEIHPDVSERYGIGTRVYSCELLFSIIMLHTKSDVVYKPLPKYPAVTRDISLIVSEDVTVGAIEDVIFENGGKDSRRRGTLRRVPRQTGGRRQKERRIRTDLQRCGKDTYRRRSKRRSFESSGSAEGPAGRRSERNVAEAIAAVFERKGGRPHGRQQQSYSQNI